LILKGNGALIGVYGRSLRGIRYT